MTITGWLTPEEVQEKLKNIDIYLSTAQWEGLPYAVLEAMNQGKPLLLTDCIGNCNLVREGINGALYTSAEEAAEKLRQWMRSPECLAAMGKASKKILTEEFSLETMKSAYRDLYFSSAT